MLKVNLIKGGDSGTIMLEGSINSDNAPELQKKLLGDVAPRFQHLTLDLAKVPYVSSAGLRVLKVLYRTMTEKQGDMKLKNVREDVMSVFRITGFVRLFECE